MTTALATMEEEMVLLAMLPVQSQVLLVQTPRLRSVGDLEQFVVDEYARVFPQRPALNPDLRIQKCVSPANVVDHRSPANRSGSRKQAPTHFFVDLAKNVQVGNAFENMEQIYVVFNSKKAPEYQQPRQLADKPQIPALVQTEKSEAEKPMDQAEKHKAEKPKAEKHKAEKPKAQAEKTKAEKPKAQTEKPKTQVEKPKAQAEKSKKAEASANQQKSETVKAKAKAPVAAKVTVPAATKKAEKAVPQPKSKNSLLEQMRAARESGAESGAAVISKSLSATESTKKAGVKDKAAHTRKASEQEAEASGKVSAPPAKKPRAKKKAVVVAPEATATVPTSETEEAQKPKKASRKTKKKVDAETDETDKPAAKRAKTQAVASPKETMKAAAAKKALLEPEATKKGDKPVAGSPSSASDEASGEETEVTQPMSTFKQRLAEMKESLARDKHQSLGADEPEKVTKPTEKEVKPAAAKTKKTPKVKPADDESTESSDTDMEPKKVLKKEAAEAAPKKQEAKTAKSPPKKAAPVESSSSSDEEDLDYSQSLLAELIDSDMEDEKESKPKSPPAPAPASPKKTKKINVVMPTDEGDAETSQDSQESQDMLSSELTQASQESKSVLAPSLSRNRFSLGSIPVAKLKKSSKNPFTAASPKKSPKKAKGKASRLRKMKPKA